MFYIKDMKDLWGIGVVDTADNSIEYYSKSQIREFVKRGIRIAGVTHDFDFFKVKDSEIVAYYTGDYQGISKYDALITSLADGVSQAGKKAYRMGMLYKGYLTKERNHCYGFSQKPRAILIGDYNTKRIRYQETLEEYSYRDRRLQHIRYLPEVTMTADTVHKAFLMIGSPLREHYDYGYKLSKSALVDVVQANIITDEYAHGVGIFIIRLEYLDSEKRVVVITSTNEFVFLETFYTDFISKSITVYNAVLTKNGFTYWGLDGTYSVDMDIVRRNGKFISRDSIISEARSKVVKTSGYVVQEDGVLTKGRVFGDKLEIPKNCRFIDYYCISKEDNVPVSQIIIPTSVIGSKNVGHLWCLYRERYFASDITVKFMSNSVAAVFDLFILLNDLYICHKKHILFDWDSSNKATLLIGYFTYAHILQGEINKLSVQDVALCAKFYLDVVTPKILQQCVTPNISDIWVSTKDGRNCAKLTVGLRLVRYGECKTLKWQRNFTKTLIAELESKDGIKFLVKYLKNRETLQDSDVDCIGWFTCYEWLISVRDEGFRGKFYTEELRSFLMRFEKVVNVLLNAHITCLKRVVENKAHGSFYKPLIDKYF